MTDLVWARSTMALSLGFHIIFASISMVLPFFMARAHWLFLHGGDRVHLRLTKAWSHGAAVLFATGAVSGTALSFQLGLLWPGFMEHAGPIIGMPFSLEGAAFFLEAIFLGLFLYGWERLAPRIHFLSGLMVGVCGLASGVLVIAANGWMNSPSGFDWDGAQATNIQPWAAMFNRAWPLQALHMLVAAIQATSFAALGVHALSLLRLGRSAYPERDPETGLFETALFHREALRVIAPFAVVASLVQPLIGDLSAKSVAQRQPEKLAAFEAHFKTERGASLWIGGIPDEQAKTVHYGVAVPKALSILAFADPNAEVRGLDAFPAEDRPPVLIPHLAFQVMVGTGSLLLLFSVLWIAARKWRPSLLKGPLYLKALVLLAPLGFLALEAGWVVTEVGRQPWVLYHVIRTADAVTPVPGQVVTFVSIGVLYGFLGLFSVLVLTRLFRLESQKEVDSKEEWSVAE
jgi:cytochrome bd ubiquinol oxidase subunit I